MHDQRELFPAFVEHLRFAHTRMVCPYPRPSLPSKAPSEHLAVQHKQYGIECKHAVTTDPCLCARRRRYKLLKANGNQYHSIVDSCDRADEPSNLSKMSGRCLRSLYRTSMQGNELRVRGQPRMSRLAITRCSLFQLSTAMVGDQDAITASFRG